MTKRPDSENADRRKEICSVSGRLTREEEHPIFVFREEEKG